MYLKYSDIDSGNREQPVLRLRTLSGKELGTIPYVHDLKFTINYADTSTIEFTTPYFVNGSINPIYDKLTSFKVIYTENLGIYVLTSPQKSGDGIMEEKTVKGYSLEILFQKKSLFLEEGTYNFWNPINSADTVLGRIFELDQTWKPGYIAPRLIGCYRTFDQYDNDAMSFCYGDAMEKYACVFVFDVYKKEISVYDATEDLGNLPIYLSYANLVSNVSVNEMADDLVTKLHLYGSDDLTVREVNPTGTDYIVNLDYFLYSGDLDTKLEGSSVTLADRVRNWQTAIRAKQSYYTGLIAARSSIVARKLLADSQLTDLNGELDSLTAQQSVTIQAVAMEKTAEGKAVQQAKLDTINANISTKNGQISAKQAEITAMTAESDDYMEKITTVTHELGYEYFFTQDERNVLNQFMIDGNLEDETFVASEVDTTASATISTSTGNISVTSSDLTRSVVPNTNKTMVAINGGSLSLPGANISATVIRGTLEITNGTTYVLSCYLGSVSYSGHSFQKGMLTFSGTMSDFTSDIHSVTEQGVTEDKGTQFGFMTANAATYFTVNTNDFQKYSVALELYDFGQDALNENAWPIFEFSVDSANFLFQEKFEPFKNSLELGKAVRLELGSEGIVLAKVIGVELDYEDISRFNLLFSNRYQMRDGRRRAMDMTNTVSKSSRSINAGKYTYNRSAEKITEVEEVMNQQLDASVRNIVNKADQTVLINSSGINIGGKSNYQMRLVDNMIAMTDNSWQTAKLAIGRFTTESAGTQWGVNAEMLAGNIIIGNNLILQNTNDVGTMMFQVDASGAWLQNSQFILSGTNGKILLSPKYGIIGGGDKLFTTSGTTVTPSFIDGNGDIIYDSDDMPLNANFGVSIKDGSAFFRGKVTAQSGSIGGYTIDTGYLHSGTSSNYVALNGGTTVYSDYAMWAGNTNPTYANFWVKKNGDMYAAGNAIFKGTLQAAKIKETLKADNGGKIIGPAIYVPDEANYKFKVDEYGNVTIRGGAITWDDQSFPVQSQFSTDGSSWHATMQSNDKYRRDKQSDGTWGAAYQFKGNDGLPGRDGRDGTVDYSQVYSILRDSYGITRTSINETQIASPTIRGGSIYGATMYAQNYNVISDQQSGKLSLRSSAYSGTPEVFYIEYYNSAGIPYITIGSSTAESVIVYGKWDFSHATVSGLSNAAVFG